MAEADTETSKKEEPGISAKTESKGDRPSNLCCYSQRTCNLEKLKGFDFCHKHILEDKASPFKPCDFVAKSNERRCPNPAPKLPSRGKSFCIIHTRKAELRRAVEERRKRRRQDNVEGNYNEDDKGKRRRTSSANSQRSDKLDGHSSEDDAGGSGEEYLKVDSAWHGGIDSDADSVDSEEEDPLKHAGVWTTEEATRVCRDKMIRLRLLYIAQFKRLQHVLKERQRKYCQAIQAEEEEESGECHLTPTQLLGHKQRHERPGTEALLHRQAKEKRVGTTTRQQNMAHLRCTFSPGGNRCSERVLPLTKHCIKHITHDPNQLLYQKCSFPSRGDSPCDMNAPKIFTHTTCRLHLELPTNMKRPHIKKDLLDAKERAKARRAAAVEAKEGDNEAGLVPEALQQKSSALIPPAGSSQSDDGLPVSCQSQASTPLQSPNVQSTDHIKMEVDDDGDEKAGDSESTRTVKTTQSSSTTLKSESTVTASESISPGLAAASLVVVCSSPQLPVTGMPLASTSGGIQQSSVADSKLGTNARQEGGSCVSSVVGKYDANAKDSPIIKASDLKAKVTPNKPKETTDGKTVSSDVNSAAATGSLDTSAKLAVNTKAGVNVVKQEMEKTSASKVCPKSTIPHEALQGTSLNCPPGTSQVSHQQQSAPKVTSQVSLKNVSESASQIPSHASSQTTSQAPLQVASQSASQASSQTASRAPLQASSQSASQVLSQAALQSATQASSQTASQTALQPSSQSASQALSQAASQGASQSSQIASQGPSQAASQSASHGSSHGVTQHLLKSTSQVDTKLRQAPVVSSASSVNPSKSMPTTGPSTVLSPAVNSPKPPAGDESSRMLALKDFKHLPSGMTASTSKQYGSMITGHSRESLNKDSKTEKGPA